MTQKVGYLSQPFLRQQVISDMGKLCGQKEYSIECIIIKNKSDIYMIKDEKEKLEIF